MYALGVMAQSLWVKTVSEKSGVSFEMPGKPNLRNQDTDKISSEVFSLKDAVNVFGVVASDFSKMGLNFTYSDPSEYYKEMRDASLVSSDAVLISERSVAYQKMLGKEITYAQLVGKHEYTYYKRFFFRGNFIYQFAIGGPSRMKNILLDKKNLYFNSIHFLDVQTKE
ncbi:hypothetical protein DLK05_08730 [Ancylomarina longa]|uniref:Uncharacterized protein n=2 Tax=Ancylomarina longa TaxID=2487017 RepID=A0A434AVB2_9BACT|nr:hypothetical protein DLK05_08730 [Ancylomarina longa]